MSVMRSPFYQLVEIFCDRDFAIFNYNSSLIIKVLNYYSALFYGFMNSKVCYIEGNIHPGIIGMEDLICC